jgi:hypothetical protein
MGSLDGAKVNLAQFLLILQESTIEGSTPEANQLVVARTRK